MNRKLLRHARRNVSSRPNRLNALPRRRLMVESLEGREMLSGVSVTADSVTFADVSFELVGKALPDEWYNGFGQPYVAYGDQQPGEAGQAKVNHDYIWGMASTGNDIWFGTSGNASITAQMASRQQAIVNALGVGEGEYSQYQGVPDSLKPMLGDWRPPTMHHYNVNTGVLEDVTPDDPLVNWTLGLRSAGANSQVVILAGPDLTMTGTCYFAFNAKTGGYLGSKHLTDYGDIRRWVTVNDQLYVGVLRTWSTTGEGAVLRWRGTLSNPFVFEEVGNLNLEAAYLVAHQGRLYASTWNLWNATLMGQQGYRSEDYPGIWRSPELGVNGLTADQAGQWQKVWDVRQYDTDPVIAQSLGGGAMASFDGYLYWGIMQVQNSGKNFFQESYPNENPADLLAKTTVSTAIFRSCDFSDPSSVELLYGDNNLWHYTPAGADPIAQPAVWALVPNGTGTATWGAAGFGNPQNIYCWSMAVDSGNLYVGTLDMNYLYLKDVYIPSGGDSDLMEQMMADRGVPNVRVGADVYCFPSGGAQPYAITLDGAGNPLNNGIRNMVSTNKGLFLGAANPSNLMTTPYDPVTQPLKCGGWELIHVVTAGRGSLAGAAGTQSSSPPDSTSNDTLQSLGAAALARLAQEQAADGETAVPTADRFLPSIDLVSTAVASQVSATANGKSQAPSVSSDGRYVAFQSEADNLVAGDDNGLCDIFVIDLAANTVVLASTGSAGALANGASSDAALSADGRYVAFTSEATNLVSRDSNKARDVFVKDLLSGATVRASTSTTGAQANGDSFGASLSADGRYVAFASNATNLSSHDTNGATDIFVKDLRSGATLRVSTADTQADRASSGPRLSNDGRYVAFTSEATNLVAGDTNGLADLFVEDLWSGTIVRANVSSTGGQANGGALSPAFSADGRYVAFLCYANNLVAGDTNGQPDIFVKDLQSGAITLVSTDSSGVEGNLSSENPTLSADGRYVAFRSYASNLVANDTNNLVDVFVKDLVSGATSRVSTDRTGTAANNDSYRPSISGNGLLVVFETDASNLIPTDTNAARDIAVKTLATGVVRTASPAVVPQWGATGDSSSPATSADGRYVAFASDAANLVTGDTNGKTDVFRKDLADGTVVRVSTATGGGQGNKNSLAPSISADGRYVAFRSYASNLVSNDYNAEIDVFVKDLQTGELRRVSVNGDGVEADDTCYDPTLSADGRYVAFASDATNLVAGDTNGHRDVFVKDLFDGGVVLASGGATAADGDSSEPDLSADGRYVTFVSSATNLVAGDTNGVADVFVRDLAGGSIVRVSIGKKEANGASSQPVISGDGRFVAFSSLASNLVTGDRNQVQDVFLKDLASGAILRVSTTSGGKQANRDSGRPSISSDGQLVAFDSAATNLVSGDRNSATDVFVKDLRSGVTNRISMNTSGVEANGKSDSPSLSANGLFVAFDSVATNLAPSDGPHTQDVFRARASARLSSDSLGQDDPAAASGYEEPGAGWLAVLGDWNGDGTVDAGYYDPNGSIFYLGGSDDSGDIAVVFAFGQPGAGWQPLAGDWNGDGRSGLGLYDPLASVFYLTDSLQTGFAEHTFGFGQPLAVWTPIVGDWNGDGRDGVGLYDPAQSTFYLTDTLATGSAQHTFAFGQAGAGWQPLVGDWNHDLCDGIGLFAPQSSTIYLTDSFQTGTAQYTFGYPPSGGTETATDAAYANLSAGIQAYCQTSAANDGPEHALDFGQRAAISAQAVDQIDLASVVAHELDRLRLLDDTDGSVG